MADRSGSSILGSILHGIKRIGLLGLKVIYLLPFFAFGAWLIAVVYFQDLNLNTALSLSKPTEEEVGYEIITRKKKDAVPRGHFHMIDDYVAKQEPNPPICVVCHGTYPHGKEKKVRAMLNMHTGFIACSVCHTRQDAADETAPARPKSGIDAFLWVDRESGEITHTVEGEYGKYPAKIYPIRHTEQGPERIYTPIKADAAQRFLKMRPDLTPDQVAEAKAKLHSPLSQKPVFCSDCHQKDGYLDLKTLGFPKQRIDHLLSSEFIGMIDKYKTFYLPSVIDFRGH